MALLSKTAVTALTIASLLGVGTMGCSGQQTPAQAPPAKASDSTLGPYPMGVTVDQNPYTLRLSEVKVLAPSCNALMARGSPNPPVTDIPARDGYRYVDVTIALQATLATATTALQHGVVATSSVLAAGRIIPATGQARGYGSATPVVDEFLEFEVPVDAHDAVLRLKLKGSSATVSFRLW